MFASVHNLHMIERTDEWPRLWKKVISQTGMKLRNHMNQKPRNKYPFQSVTLGLSGLALIVRGPRKFYTKRVKGPLEYSIQHLLETLTEYK